MTLKNLVTTCVLGTTLMGAMNSLAVDETSTFMVGPVGEVVYADGTTVADEECYVVIFTADGYEFAGFTTDGHLVEPKHSAVVMYGPMSEVRGGTACGMGTKELVKQECLDPLNCTDGVFELYLLDTRISDGFAPIDDEDIDNSTWLPTTINAWSKATGSNVIKYSNLTFDRSDNTVNGNSGSITTESRTVIGTATPIPVMVSIVWVNGVATIAVTNTVSTANYCLKGSLDLSFTNTVWNCATEPGNADARIPLEIRDSNATNSAAFYRVEVVK